jgi:hypothetical protein
VCSSDLFAAPNVFLAGDRGADLNQYARIRRLRDVAWGPMVKTGASVPGYSGGFAAAPNVF